MAHNLATIGNRVAFAYHGGLPWHGLGQNVSSLMTSAEAIEAANLNWNVRSLPIAAWAGGLVDLPSHKAIVRDEPCGKVIPLGVVGSKFQPVQNREVFDFMDSLVEGGEIRYETAGALREGREVFMAAKVTADPIEVVPGDKVEQYLVACNGHDGTRALTVFFTSVRVVCNNTLNAALAGSRGNAVKIAHRGDVGAKREVAQRVLGIASKRRDAFAKTAQALAAEPMTATEFRTFVEKLIPAPPTEAPAAQEARVIAIRDVIARNWEGGAGADLRGVRGTRWGALNAVTEYTTHAYGPRTSADRRFSMTFGGANDELAQKAYVMLAAA